MSSPTTLRGEFNITRAEAEADPPAEFAAATVDSDFVVILAALLCALICVIGLVAVARCAWLRRTNGGNINSSSSSSHAPANKGLKKKILRSLPKQGFTEELKGKLADCAICLTEFEAGDEIRILPQCGHGFHVGCIDTWLGSHSSCPSCRQILVATRCHKCGGFPERSSSAAAAAAAATTSSAGAGVQTATEAELKAREDDINRFLP